MLIVYVKILCFFNLLFNFTFCSLQIMSDSQETCILCSQYAQDPNEGVTEYLQELRNQAAELKKIEQKKEAAKKRSGISSSSFVISKAKKGIRMIRIQVLDLENNTSTYSSSECSDSAENVMLSAQYVLSDTFDEIMDLTENVIRKISKKLTSDNF